MVDERLRRPSRQDERNPERLVVAAVLEDTMMGRRPNKLLAGGMRLERSDLAPSRRRRLVRSAG